MSNQFQLRGVGDSELLAGLADLVRRGNQITSEVLAHLGEVEERLLYAELGFSSLHAYCVKVLGMSEGAAGRRVAGARVCRRFPEVFARVASGELHLSAVCALATHATAENAQELFAACSRKSRRQVDEAIAARFPRADVKEQIRRLPIETLGPERFGVHFTADTELRDLIERARAIASHRLPGGELAGLMKIVFEEFVAREEKRRFAVGSKSRRGTEAKRAVARGAKSTGTSTDTSTSTSTSTGTPPGGVKRKRYVAASVRRAVFERDGGRCSFVAKDGRRCGCRRFLEIDHIKPWARLGESTLENLRLRCRAHNRLHAQRCFGRLYLWQSLGGRHSRQCWRQAGAGLGSATVSGLWPRADGGFRRRPGRRSRWGAGLGSAAA